MADIKPSYGTSVALTITLASLATDANLLAGREATAVDNTSALEQDYLIAGKITTGTSPTTGKKIRVYAIGLMEDSAWPDVFEGTDSDETISSAGTRDAIGRLVAEIATDATSDRTYYFGPVPARSVFGDCVPKKFTTFVTHDTAVNLNSTGSNHAIYVTPVHETIS